MKERFITAFLMVSMCVALHGSGTTSYLRAQQRQLRMDNLTMLSAAGGQENNITQSSIPTKETTTTMTMTERVDNGTILEGDKVVLLSQNNASNVTILTHSPPQAEDINVTIDNMTNNWMTPVTLNSSLSIEETLIETNHTSASSSTELDKSNSTNNNITLEVMSSTLAPPQLNETALEEIDESSSNNNVTNTTITTPDLVLATVNATATYAPTTSSLSSSTPTVAQSIINSPTVNPTPLLLDTAAPSNGFDTTTSAPTSTPTDAQTSLNPSSANPTPQLDSAAVSVSPTSMPTIVQTIRSPTFNPTQQSDAPKMSNLDLYNATSSKNSTSSKPTVQPTQDYDDDYDYHYYDDGPPFTYDDDKSANITSTTPAPRPTYSPTTTAEANDAIYTIYHPTYQKKKEEVANSPTYSPTEPYPTYSPTTTRKGKRVKKRQNKRDKNTTKKRPRKQNAAPTGSPTVVEMEFLEDVSASKTIPLVIGVILTILGIGCCAWCV